MEKKPFPASLEQYRHRIEATAIPSVLLSLEEGQTELYKSKIGGIPYFPWDYPADIFYVPHPARMNPTPWPKHSVTGKELMLLLQLNFEELPALPFFPDKGILQIFVDDRDWHNLTAHLKVIYHREVKKDFLFSGFNVPPDSFRISEHAISFHKETEYMGASDFRFDFDKVYRNQDLWRDYLSITDHRFSGDEYAPGYGRNKIGGYHYSQNGQDPRKSLPDWEDSLLLVQLQDYDQLSWGDCGSAQFFIKRKDLEHLNFNDLLFHWDST
jgi:uncharacterized protein YwqG